MTDYVRCRRRLDIASTRSSSTDDSGRVASPKLRRCSRTAGSCCCTTRNSGLPHWNVYFRSGRRIGDELWIGAQVNTDFSDLCP